MYTRCVCAIEDVLCCDISETNFATLHIYSEWIEWSMGSGCGLVAFRRYSRRYDLSVNAVVAWFCNWITRAVWKFDLETHKRFARALACRQVFSEIWKGNLWRWLCSTNAVQSRNNVKSVVVCKVLCAVCLNLIIALFWVLFNCVYVYL